MRDARLSKLQAAQLYLCTPEPMAPPGSDIVQLRRKGLEWRAELALLRRLRESVLDTAAAQGEATALVSANDRADLAAFAPVDVLHLGQDDLPPALARRIVGPEILLGLSTHDEAQVAAAVVNPDIDYFCVGPVWETPTKAGRPGVGLELLERAVALAPPFGPGLPSRYALPATDVEERVLGESRGATPPSANAANDSANAANEQLASRPASAGPDDPVNPCKTD